MIHETYDLKLDPESLEDSIPGHFTVIVHNKGKVELPIELFASDERQRARYELMPSSLKVPPGAKAKSHLLVVPTDISAFLLAIEFTVQDSFGKSVKGEYSPEFEDEDEEDSSEQETRERDQRSSEQKGRIEERQRRNLRERQRGEGPSAQPGQRLSFGGGGSRMSLPVNTTIRVLMGVAASLLIFLVVTIGIWLWPTPSFVRSEVPTATETIEPTITKESVAILSPTATLPPIPTATPLSIPTVTLRTGGSEMPTPSETAIESSFTPTNTPVEGSSSPTNTPEASFTLTNTPLRASFTPTKTPEASFTLTKTPETSFTLTKTPETSFTLTKTPETSFTPTKTPLRASFTPTTAPVRASFTPTNTPLRASLTPTNTPQASFTPTNTPLRASLTATNTPVRERINTPTYTTVPNTNTPTLTTVPPTPTLTSVPPTETPTLTSVPPTETPTLTSVPPTETPTLTSVPPTETPTLTSVPATETPTVPQPPSLSFPDLMITSLEVTGSPIQNNDGGFQVPILVIIQNQGEGTSDIFKVAIEATQSQGTFVVPFTVVGQSSIWYPFTSAPLMAGSRVIFEGSVQLANFPSGEVLTITAIADSCSGEEFMPDYCRIEESNERNNRSTPASIRLP